MILTETQSFTPDLFCLCCFWQNGSLLVDYTLDEIRKEADIKPLLRNRNAVFATSQANDWFYHVRKLPAKKLTPEIYSSVDFQF